MASENQMWNLLQALRSLKRTSEECKKEATEISILELSHSADAVIESIEICGVFTKGAL